MTRARPACAPKSPFLIDHLLHTEYRAAAFHELACFHLDRHEANIAQARDRFGRPALDHHGATVERLGYRADAVANGQLEVARNSRPMFVAMSPT